LTAIFFIISITTTYDKTCYYCKTSIICRLPSRLPPNLPDLCPPFSSLFRPIWKTHSFQYSNLIRFTSTIIISISVGWKSSV
jgi:hypothetical protein